MNGREEGPAVCVGERTIGAGFPCFVIAEAGVNHNGDVRLAHRLVDAAAGADAVKFQTFDPESLVSPVAPCADYQKKSGASSQKQLLQELVLPPAAHRELAAHAKERGLVFLSSPFDEASADFLEELGVPAFKVPSGEVVNTPFLAHLARKGRPLLVSTGMCGMADVERAVDVIRTAGDPPLALFHCVSCYPAAPRDANLRAMETLRARFGCPVGFSDHTLGLSVATAAAALGANLLEKHLTLDKNLPGPDHRASLDPAEFQALISAVREAEVARGSGRKEPSAAEAEVAAVARKSLHWRVDIEGGTIVELGHLIALRPGTGIPPYRAAELAGCRLRAPVRAGSMVEMPQVECRS